MCMCNFAWKGHPWNDLYCVGRDVKLYSLIHCPCFSCHCWASIRLSAPHILSCALLLQLSFLSFAFTVIIIFSLRSAVVGARVSESFVFCLPSFWGRYFKYQPVWLGLRQIDRARLLYQVASNTLWSHNVRSRSIALRWVFHEKLYHSNSDWLGCDGTIHTVGVDCRQAVYSQEMSVSTEWDDLSGSPALHLWPSWTRY